MRHYLLTIMAAQKGRRVVIQGLQCAREFNGKNGTIIGAQTDGRWQVRIDGVTQHRGVKPDNLQILADDGDEEEESEEEEDENETDESEDADEEDEEADEDEQ